MVKRLIIAVVLSLTFVLPGMAISPSVTAEAGCSAGASTPFNYTGGPEVRGRAYFGCGTDTGARQIQSCVIVGGTWWDCDTAYPTAASGNVTAECHSYSGSVQSTTWYWFYGEDGSTSSGYSTTVWTKPCDYGID